MLLGREVKLQVIESNNIETITVNSRMNGTALIMQPTTNLKTTSADINTEKKYYGHSKSEIIKTLTSEFGDYKYTVYRCAAKILFLQGKLFLKNVPYKLVRAIFGRYGINDSETHFMIPPFQLTSIIHDIYFACENLGFFQGLNEFQLEKATLALANFFWNIYDPQFRYSISLLEVEVAFILLCKPTNNEEIISEIYKFICDRRSKFVSKYHFEYLLTIIAKLLTYIGEESAYGVQNIGRVVEQTFVRCHNLLGLTEQEFLSFFIYANLITTVKRMGCTEKIVHNHSCGSCGVDKIVGIRFKCRSCKNLSLCLKCFASGYKTNKHKMGHRIYEMLTEDQPSKKVSQYFAYLCNAFFKHQSNIECDNEVVDFCDENEVDTPNETELVEIALKENTHEKTDKMVAIKDLNSTVTVTNEIDPSIAVLTRTAASASEVSARLQCIIDRLLIQNFKIERYLQFLPTAAPEKISDFLKSHQQFLTDTVKEMHSLKSLSNVNMVSLPTSSTPNNSHYLNRALLSDNSNLSALDKNLSHSIHGAEINRSYLDANKSDYSLNDISFWFNQRCKSFSNKTRKRNAADMLPECKSNETVKDRETEMFNFRFLLQKVKEIVEDSYSDNTELAAATQNLENVLDSIIRCEETRRCST